jgi:hypothetical protein
MYYTPIHTYTHTRIHTHTQKKVLTDPACVDPMKEAKRKKQKTSMSMGDSAKVRV